MLLISFLSTTGAHFGFERVLDTSSAYRAAVHQSDAVRDVDRGLTSYTLLVRYFLKSGVPEDEASALAAERQLRTVIEHALEIMKGTARLAEIVTISEQFSEFEKLFRRAASLKAENRQIEKEELSKVTTTFKYKLEDIVDGVTKEGDASNVASIKEYAVQAAGVMELVSGFLSQPSKTSSNTAIARLKLLKGGFESLKVKDLNLAENLTQTIGLLGNCASIFARIMSNVSSFDEAVLQMSAASDKISELSRGAKESAEKSRAPTHRWLTMFF